jgi:hypothetical protein
MFRKAGKVVWNFLKARSPAQPYMMSSHKLPSKEALGFANDTRQPGDAFEFSGFRRQLGFLHDA